MTLISIYFFLFLILTAVLYYLCPKKVRFLVLLAASGFYYYSAQGVAGSLIFLGYIVLFLGDASLISRYRERIMIKRCCYFAALFLAAGGLVFFKFENPWGIPAPLGISFWMLSGIGFLTDVYWGTVTGKIRIAKSALFLGFFPLMISGPIVRYQDNADDLAAGHKLEYTRFLFGVQRIVWGCFKKLVLSERFAVIVDTVFGDYQTYPGFYVLLAMICFSLQLYTDFSGCMDIVIGAAQLFGVKLPENFRTPFFSRSVAEFWRRWHITLGAWLKDYVLYPLLHCGAFRKLKKVCKKLLGKKRGELPPLYLGMFISWFLIGFWHGKSVKYIFGVGIWFWMLIVASELCTPLFKRLIQLLRVRTDCFSYRLFQSLQTFLLVTLGFTFFRAESAREALKLLRAACSNFNPQVLIGKDLLTVGLTLTDTMVLVFGTGLLLAVSVMQYRGRSVREWVARQNLLFRWFIYLSLFFLTVILGKYGKAYDAADFIYQGF